MGLLADSWNHKISRQIEFTSCYGHWTATTAGIGLAKFHPEALCACYSVLMAEDFGGSG